MADRPPLCTDCALCCSGALFDSVPVAQAEAEGVAALGLEIVRREQGLGFSQPCPLLRGQLCGVYEGRPPACRRFRCTLLERYEAGEVGFDEAKEKIGRARSMIEQARMSFAEGESVAAARQRWKTAGLPGAGGEAARFHLLMTALNRFLDRHFRPEGQRQVIETTPEGSPAQP